jgi:hypothetical protein
MYANHPAEYANCSIIWSDHLVLYSDCPTLHADGPNGPFSVCTVHGGSSAGLDNSFLKTGPDTAGLGGLYSCADGPVVWRSTNLSPICIRGCGCPGYVSIDIP